MKSQTVRSTAKRRVLGSLIQTQLEDVRNIALTPVTSTPQSELQNGEEDKYLFCPICNESMVSLSQLNQHIDDMHAALLDPVPVSIPDRDDASPLLALPSADEFLNGSVTKWLRSNFEGTPLVSVAAPESDAAMKSISSPLPLKRKTIKLDLLDKNKGFSLSESDNTRSKEPEGFLISPTGSKSRATSSSSNNGSPLKQATLHRLTRSHWKQPSPLNQDYCYMEGCRKTLNIKNGKVNCRKCGLLFCNEHTNYRIRLQNSGKLKLPDFEPSKNGIWSRVCKNCCEERQSIDNSNPLTNDLTNIFRKRRQESSDEREIQRNKLKKRFIKIVNLHYERFLEDEPVSSWLVRSGDKLIDEEMKIVGLENWQSDSQVKLCPLCYSTFNFFTRRHHCRICGRIVCDGTLSNNPIVCSMSVPINLFLEKGLSNLNYSPLVRLKMEELKKISSDDEKFSIRCCNDCKDGLIHDWRNSHTKISKNSSNDGDINNIFKIYQQLLLTKEGISGVYPRYKNLIDEYKSGSLDSINKLRVRLMSFLRDFEALVALFKKSFFILNESKLLKPRDEFGSDYQKVINNIYQSSTGYLQDILINIKALSNTLKEKENKSLKVHQQYLAEATAVNNTSEQGSIQSLTSISTNNSVSPVPPPLSSPTRDDLTKRQIRELREELMVMNEQKFIIENLIEQVTKRRKYDELKPLADNKHELENNIRELELKLGEFGF